MRISDFQPVLEKLQGRVLIVTHERPDGDAVGSATALWHLLNGNGYEADVLFPDEVPDAYLCFLPETALKTADLTRYDSVLSVDASTPKRLGLGGLQPEQIKLPFAALDHHPDHIEFAQVTYVDSTACSAAEVVYDLAKFAKWNITPAAATRLLLGVVTDSGCFRFDNTTPRALRTSADLIEAGADRHFVIDRAYFSKPFNMAQFEAELFCKSLRTALDGSFAWFMITNELLKKYDVNIRNTENLIENVRGIEGVTVAAVIKPTANPGIFKVSLRSKDPAVSVGKVARRLNGGGHEMAAGCTIFAKSAENAEDILLNHVAMELKK